MPQVNEGALVAVIMGSKADSDMLKPTLQALDGLGIDYEVKVISAHRTPEQAREFGLNAQKRCLEVIIAAAGRAAHLKKAPVYVMGIGQHHIAWDLPERPTLTTSGAKVSGETAFQMAGITPDDVDICELYDCFTIVPIITLEDYGFCAKGEGGAFVEDGRTGPGGALPVNTGGGLLSESGMAGMQLLVEAVRQLRGECGERQVTGPEIAVVSGQGGIMHSHATAVLRR